MRIRRILKYIVIVAIVIFSINLIRNYNNNNPVSDNSSAAIISQKVSKIRKLTSSGGRVAWFKGDAHSLIAYDAISSWLRKNTELYTIEENGRNKFCVTCKAKAVPKGFTGQPSWHPGGQQLIFQAEGSNSSHNFFNHMAWGFDANLWMINKDGTNPYIIWESQKNESSLHPHFSKDGKTLIFSERKLTGRKISGMDGVTPGGENQWTGWSIHIADVSKGINGNYTLSNHRNIKPNGEGFYETHGFDNSGNIVYSFTSGGRNYVDDIYAVSPSGRNIKTLVKNGNTWDEHGSYNKDESLLAFMSSRSYPWQYGSSKNDELKTELFIQDKNGKVTQLTSMNDPSRRNKRILVSDFDWNAAGNKIVFQAAPVDTRTGNPDHPEIWVIELNP